MMDRRTFLCGLTLGTLAVPLAAEAQPAGKAWRIGYLAPGARVIPLMDAFYAGLREGGHVTGRDIVVDERFTDGTPEQLLAAATELVALPVDVLVSAGTAASFAAKKATSTVQIVFWSVPDPVVVGFVASLPRPGGNMTGITADAASEMPAKRLQLLKEAVPRLSRVAVLHAQDDVNVPPQLDSIKHAATSLKIGLDMFSFRGPGELEAIFALMRKQGAQGLLIVPGALTWTTRQKIADLALAYRLPSGNFFREGVAAGGLVSLGPNYVDMLRQVAQYVNKILKGAKPADLPVEQPTKFELVINLKTAKALGLSIPPSLLLRADQIIDP